MLEPYPELVDIYADNLSIPKERLRSIDGTVSIKKTIDLIKELYNWALEINWDCKSSQKYLWYVSQEKLEPRLGNRFSEKLDKFD